MIFEIVMSGEKKGNPETLIQKYRKLEENKVCPNCGEESKLGFTNVCGISRLLFFIFSSLQVLRLQQLQGCSPGLLPQSQGILEYRPFSIS